MVRRASLLAVLFWGAQARASAPEQVGVSPRSAALAQADASSDVAASAAMLNPTAATADGLHLSVAYLAATPRFQLRGEQVKLPWLRGTVLGLQRGARIGSIPVGVALGAYLPDQGLTRVVFRPASEPIFVQHESSAAKATFDLVAAIGGRLRAAAGVSLGATTEGPGVRVELAQDARGVHTDGAADLAVAYRFAPIVALSYVPADDLAISARLRGPRSFGAALDATTAVTVRDNPLMGTTEVRLRGDAAYDPLQADLGVTMGVHGTGGWTSQIFLALRYERWSAAPAPVADTTIEFKLEVSPFERTESFGRPSYRDTLSPRGGLEFSSPERLLALRLGYAYHPSPLAQASGYLTPLLPAHHDATAGLGLDLQQVFGLRLPASIDLSGGVQITPERSFRKENLALPWATYTLGGAMPFGLLGLTLQAG